MAASSTALASGAKLLVIPAFEHGRLSLAVADALIPRLPKNVAVLVRGPFATPLDFEALRGRADGIWIAGPLMRAPDLRSFLEPLVSAAENG